MTQTNYALSWILPHVRRALTGSNNFDYRLFVLHLWAELERVQVPGVIRTDPQRSHTGQVFQYDQAPHELRVVTTEAFLYLFHNGYTTLGPSDGALNHPMFGQYYVTERGREWFKGGDPLPEDVAGY